MKKLAYLLMLPLALLFTQCENGDVPEETVDLGSVDWLDLNEYGYPISIPVPRESEATLTPAPLVDVLDWGAVEIRV